MLYPAAVASRTHPQGYGEDGVSKSTRDHPLLIPWAFRKACTGADAQWRSEMDIQTLKGLAEHLRSCLAGHQIALKHGHALDLIAAVPGLRNWSEVMAFPARVAAANLDELSLARLNRRVRDRHAISISNTDLLQALSPEKAFPAASGLRIWPDGPPPGLYFTSSDTAIDAAIGCYEALAGGALLYAEDAGSSANSAILLGEEGIYSPGLSRLPSGTLVVLGPLPLVQEAWGNNRDRLTIAWNLVAEARLRVLVLAQTLTPENLHSDIDLLLKEEGDGNQELDFPLGTVSAMGEMRIMRPFVERRMSLPVGQEFRTSHRLPQVVEDVIRRAVRERPWGMLVIGASPFIESWRGLAEAALPLTEYAGPACRVVQDFRMGYDGDGPVSPYFQGLPILPSVESAYAHGFRRIVVERPNHAALRAMVSHSQDTCFVVPSKAPDVYFALSQVFSNSLEAPEILKSAISIACINGCISEGNVISFCDVFVPGADDHSRINELDSLLDHIEENRLVSWQAQLDQLLNSGLLTPEIIKNQTKRHDILEFLKTWKRSGGRGH